MNNSVQVPTLTQKQIHRGEYYVDGVSNFGYVDPMDATDAALEISHALGGISIEMHRWWADDDIVHVADIAFWKEDSTDPRYITPENES